MRSTRYFSGLILVGILAVLGCGAADRHRDREPSSGASAAPGSEAAPLANRALAITVSTRIAVDDVEQGVRQVRAEVARVGGFVEQAEVDQGQSAHLDARVPAPRLQEFRDAIAKFGEVVSDSEKVEDVTDQKVDLGARLRNARAQEERLLRLLQEKTGSLADIVAVEKELGSVRETIERMEAQQQTLDKRIDLATVGVMLEHRVGPLWSRPIASIVSAAKGGLDACGQILVALAMAIVASAPTIIALVLIGFVLWRLGRGLLRWRRKGAAR
jgi:hypothetical protein